METEWLEEASPGHLTETARRSATVEALPLLATYFVSGRDTLRSREILSRQATDGLGDLLEFIEIRVLLASAQQVEPILRSILDHPSFRYQRERTESQGMIRGRLDTIRYLRQRHRISAPRRFPVESVRRLHDLPENVLAVWAALTLARALRRLPLERLPVTAPERRRAEQSSETLRRFANQPVFAECKELASRVWHAGSHRETLDRVRSRLQSGHVLNSNAYEALADWIAETDNRNLGLEIGSVEWVFYDETFDTKLFEIWCLARLLTALNNKLGEPTQTRHLVDRTEGPIAEWRIAGSTIKVFFQAGFVAAGIGEARWKYEPRPSDEPEPTGPFGAIPDISVLVQQPGGSPQPIILDPKLRQRTVVPTEEMYKILGYFGNMPGQSVTRGAILFYGPDTRRSYRIADSAGGEVLAVAVDPSNAVSSEQSFAELASFVAAPIPKSTVMRAHGPTDPNDADSTEAWVAACQTQAIAEILNAPIAPDALERARKALRSNLIASWDLLDADTQRMLASAEHFGGEASAEMDHSGPLLGLAAGCERLVRRVARLLQSKAQAMGLTADLAPTLTFGNLLKILKDAVTTRPSAISQALGSALDASTVSQTELSALIDDLFKLNQTYRIPAAHADIVEEGIWLAGRATIVVGENASVARIAHLLQNLEG